LGGVERQYSGVATINAKNDDVFIPVFLRKNTYFSLTAPKGLTPFGKKLKAVFHLTPQARI
jgi:hypothetical protein